MVNPNKPCRLCVFYRRCMERNRARCREYVEEFVWSNYGSRDSDCADRRDGAGSQPEGGDHDLPDRDTDRTDRRPGDLRH